MADRQITYGINFNTDTTFTFPVSSGIRFYF